MTPESTQQVCKICIPNTQHDFFDYVTDGAFPQVGMRVWVPFRNKTKLGVVIGHGLAENSAIPLKTILEIVDDEPLFSTELLDLCTWVSRYYQSPLSEVIPLAMPQRYRRGMAIGLPRTKKIQSGCDQHASQHGSKDTKLTLHAEQEFAITSILAKLNAYHSFLLYGVTGSGKTEVYLQVIESVLKQAKQVLVIVPEIGLTPQLLARFTARFDESIAVIHSNLSETQRQAAWQQAKENRVQLIIGTRTAVFTPLPELGLIVVDEEHDVSFKQMDGVRYSARDTALMRAYQRNIPIILGSATPSLESLHNANLHKYTLLRLKQKALNSPPLHYQLVDIRNQSLQHGLAQTSLNLIEEHLQKNQQVFVFINRRGFSPVVLCHHCGWMADCRRCDSHLTLHKRDNQLVCHHCGFITQAPVYCLSCKSTDLVPVGSGTQRIHEFLSTRFPETSMLRIDRDEVQKKEAFNQYLEQINSGAVQLIVGTQMLAKGHHFPRLTLVVVVDADQGLVNQDFRALERFGQLLTQVAGRAGRDALPGQVLIQTHKPQHPALNLLIQRGYDAFIDSLITTRRDAELPPYQFLALIRAQGKNQTVPLTFLNELKTQLAQAGLLIFGPAPAPLARKANEHRLQLLVKASSRAVLQNTLLQVRNQMQRKRIRWSIDIDPQDLS